MLRPCHYRSRPPRSHQLLSSRLSDLSPSQAPAPTLYLAPFPVLAMLPPMAILLQQAPKSGASLQKLATPNAKELLSNSSPEERRPRCIPAGTTTVSQMHQAEAKRPHRAE